MALAMATTTAATELCFLLGLATCHLSQGIILCLGYGCIIGTLALAKDALGLEMGVQCSGQKLRRMELGLEIGQEGYA